MLTSLLEKRGTGAESDELVIRQSCATMFAQGSAAVRVLFTQRSTSANSDPRPLQTVSAMGTFILAMVQNPHVQAKAQAEIDALLHGARLPHFNDFDSLPYLNAIVKECLRWNPVVPLAFPHRLEEDDIYNDYHLPAGAIVLPNTW